MYSPHLSRIYRELLENFEALPPSATVPLRVAAMVKGVSVKTIQRNFDLVSISPCRSGVRKSDLTKAT
jgi:hypothetical protein